mmetsp:Transcript_13333/g.38738  ORF Transcript_13333/g.38738 Transcript_13333/m.38738 type:complete len:116 (-) Transcript_13333:1159-1506(-)
MCGRRSWHAQCVGTLKRGRLDARTPQLAAASVPQHAQQACTSVHGHGCRSTQATVTFMHRRSSRSTQCVGTWSGAQSLGWMPVYEGSMIRNTQSSTSSTLESGVDAPDVTPMVTF